MNAGRGKVSPTIQRFWFLLCLVGTLSLHPEVLFAASFEHHDLFLTLVPDEGRLVAEDEVTLPDGASETVELFLHEGLAPSSSTPGVIIRPERKGSRESVVTFSVTRPKGVNSFRIAYGGKITHPLRSLGKEYARGFRETSGIISGEGVYLSGESRWVPRFTEGLLTFTLTVRLPKGWEAVSQGARTVHVTGAEGTEVRWESAAPQEEIFLIAGPFVEYSRPAGRITAMAFLREADGKLADRYLDATGRYLAMYEGLIGLYPYSKFALVENFWETGYGMPSFTLLGPKVIRFPFILHSSYPHEILHNWWGNGVYPDYASGNWSEGLTAYLSDHLIQEQQGRGAEYRRATLQKYADYVSQKKDFPLIRFRSRHSSSSEAVGYGKSLMLFHMLRRELGDSLFVEGLRDFYRTFRFQKATFNDLRASFEKTAKRDLAEDFTPWIERRGAPQLKITGADVRPEGAGCTLAVRLAQVQEGPPYRLRVPIAVTLEGREQTFQTEIVLEGKEGEISLSLPVRPLRLDVDPEFDLFRRLDREETPPALSRTLGAEEALILLPAGVKGDRLATWREFAEVLGHAGPDRFAVRRDDEVRTLPTKGAVILLGWENRFVPHVQEALTPYEAKIDGEGVWVGKERILRKDHAVVITVTDPKNRGCTLTWVAADRIAALSGLGRKLPHYHKYSYLAFAGEEPENTVKGRWPVLHSPLTVFFPGKEGAVSPVERGRLKKRSPLAVLPPVFSKERMMETVRFLADPKLEGRGAGSIGAGRAAEYIAAQFRAAGLEPMGDGKGSYFQEWEKTFGDPPEKRILQNVIAVLPGRDPVRKGESVVLGAHYDHLGFGWPDVRKGNRGEIHCGADDNASGVAVLLELARFFGSGARPGRTIVFVAFTGEEEGRWGSTYYVTHEKDYPAGKCLAMINLDTVGRLEGKKLLVLGASAREWTHIFRGAGYVTGIDLDVVTRPLDSSDQVSFQEAGIPAVQLFSGVTSDYHCPSDRAEKIDVAGLVKVAAVTKEVVEYLAGRKERLTVRRERNGAGGEKPKEGRKVSLGTIPDFAYSGEGCRISGVVPGTPAEGCGLREGDVILRIGDRPVHRLKDFAMILRTLRPGDRISITFLRGEEERTVEAEVVER